MVLQKVKVNKVLYIDNFLKWIYSLHYVMENAMFQLRIGSHVLGKKNEKSGCLAYLTQENVRWSQI